MSNKFKTRRPFAKTHLDFKLPSGEELAVKQSIIVRLYSKLTHARNHGDRSEEGLVSTR